MQPYLSSKSLEPSSTGAMGEGVRSCARHPVYEASKFCVSCAAPLCRACGSTKAHRLCPPCALNTNGRAHRADAQWQATLLFDAIRDWRPLLVQQIFPTAVAMSVFALVGLFVFMGRSGLGDSADPTGDYLVASAWLFGTLSLGALVVQPGIYAARKDLTPFRRRVATGALQALVVALPFAGMAALGFANGFAAALVMGVFVVLSPFLPAFLSYIQASHQLGGWSLGATLQRLGRHGLLPLLGAGIITGFCGLMMTSLFYPVLVVGGLWLVGPAIGFLALFIMLILFQLAFSYMFGAVGTSLFRLVEDRAANIQ